MRVLRVYHAGRDSSHRERDRALARAGVELKLVVPDRWPGGDRMHDEPFDVVALPVCRPGDINRHRYADPAQLRRLVDRARPDLLDLHEEPVSSVTHQVLAAVPPDLPVVGYSAQNIDKRWPPPFHRWERRALARLTGAYPCSRQAASVLRGKGYTGTVAVLPLGVDRHVFRPGPRSSSPGEPITLGFVGRLVPEKGVLDAVEVLARVRAAHPARLLVVGEGPGATALCRRARALALDVELHPWCDPDRLAQLYRRMEVLLVPSRATRTWTEQFGRVVTEARACGAVVVSYASGALPEVVGDEGMLAPECDVDAMARAVVRLVEQPRLRRGVPSNAADDVAGWDEVAHAQVELYRRVLAGDRPRPAGRAAAVAEFGAPARIGGGARPFAVPVLRQDTAVTRALARVLDGLARD